MSTKDIIKGLKTCRHKLTLFLNAEWGKDEITDQEKNRLERVMKEAIGTMVAINNYGGLNNLVNEAMKSQSGNLFDQYDPAEESQHKQRLVEDCTRLGRFIFKVLPEQNKNGQLSDKDRERLEQAMWEMLRIVEKNKVPVSDDYRALFALEEEKTT